MTDLNLRAARVQLYGLIAALVFAILVAIGLTGGAFTLSFSVLRDLATQALMPAQWAWILPAVVDGAILGATIAVVVLSKINGSDEGKKFFVRLLVAVVCISVIGNAYHAYKAAEEAARKVAAGIDIGFVPLTPAAAALIAVIPPLLVLAFSHGIGILIKAIGTAYTEYNTLVRAVAAGDDTVASVDEVVAYDTAGVAHDVETIAHGHDFAATDVASAATEILPTEWERSVESVTRPVQGEADEFVTSAIADSVDVADLVAHDTADVASSDTGIASTENEAPQEYEFLIDGKPLPLPSDAGVASMPEPVASTVADVAPTVAHDEAVESVALRNTEDVAPDVADVAPTVARDETAVSDALRNTEPETVDPETEQAADEPEHTLEDLLAFIDECAELPENVRETARLKIISPEMSFAAIAAETGHVAASTAMRRYQKAETAARDAGFSVPPLPDLALTADEDTAVSTRELVMQ
ncbi:DUF2637 domain-containing protein [Prescottella subtropica]|uniref:DUF2637 domain-containing protein n=1 Tax=Prescottella subtropica TaxID=2545757 RepID=UPI0019D600C3|nr:DUF2637 domain-containing protein [Prescottella subtropica]